MKLINAILSRNEEFTNSSKKIIEKYSDIFNTAFDYVAEGKMEVEWLTLDFHPSNSELLNIVGFAKHRVGEIIKNDFDEVIYIDENNVNNYTRPLRMILPTLAASNNQIDDVLTFIDEYNALAMTVPSEELDEMISDDTFLKKTFSIFKNDKTVKKKVSTLKHNEFELRDLGLDEVQLQQLKLLDKEGTS